MEKIFIKFDSAPMKNRVAELREIRGWGQKDLADRLNLSEAGVSRLESGKSKLDDVKLERLCHLFSCTPNDIFGFASGDVVKADDLRDIIREALNYKGILNSDQIADVAVRAYIQSLESGMTAREFRRVLEFLPAAQSASKSE